MKIMNKFPTHRLFFFIFFTFCFFFSLVSCSKTKRPPKRPNIIFILVDALRYDYLGCNGFEGDISPQIDLLAKESLNFRQCFSQSPWTKPSIATLFTSLYPETHRVLDHQNRILPLVDERFKTDILPEDAVTLAEVLKEGGYETVGFVNNSWMSKRLGYAQGFDRYETPSIEYDLKESAGKKDQKGTWVRVKTSAMEWLQERNRKTPFFLYLHFMGVHGPFQCLEDDFQAVRYSPSLGDPEVLSDTNLMRLPRYLKQGSLWDDPVKRKEVLNWRACYAAGIRKFDRELGTFFEKLEEKGLMENSLIVLTADHGEELWEHKEWGHGFNLYSEAIRVPLLIRLPGGKKGGQVIDSLVGLIDLMPTLLSFCKVDFRTPPIQGKDFSPLFLGRKREIRRWVFSSGCKARPSLVSIQGKRYKMIWHRVAHDHCNLKRQL